jgi:hypothetical protein
MPVLKPGDIACLKDRLYTPFHVSRIERILLIEIIGIIKTPPYPHRNEPELFIVKEIASDDYLVNKVYNYWLDNYIKIATKDLILYTNLQHKSERFWELIEGILNV